MNDADFIDTYRLNNWHYPFHYLPAQFCATKAGFQSDATLKMSLAPQNQFEIPFQESMKINDLVLGSDIFIKECDITKVDSSHPFYEQNNLFIYTHSCPTDEIAYFKVSKVDIEMRLDSLGRFLIQKF